MTNLNSNTSNGVKKRIILDVILFGAIFFTPWWAVAILAFIGAFFWPLYFEIFVFGILLDILYGTSGFPLGGVYGILGATVVFFAASYARRVVR